MTASPYHGRRSHAPQRLACLLALVLTGCATPGERIDRMAEQGRLTREVVSGTRFRHVTYARIEAAATTLTVYLEGDGIPWIDGREPATDPTTRVPLALQLMLASDGPALYVARPCYQQLDANCSAGLWTAARYSEEIVASMTAVIATKAKQLRADALTIVGYSGGGVLAVLVAERLATVRKVITIGANLDTDAWTSHHGYLPLTDSLNPAASTREHPWREIHYYGQRDLTVPIATTRTYLARFPQASLQSVADFDHVCCWVEDWSRRMALP